MCGAEFAINLRAHVCTKEHRCYGRVYVYVQIFHVFLSCTYIAFCATCDGYAHTMEAQMWLQQCNNIAYASAQKVHN